MLRNRRILLSWKSVLAVAGQVEKRKFDGSKNQDDSNPIVAFVLPKATLSSRAISGQLIRES